MRAKAPGGSGAAVTLRQLESLIRLAEARARCDLRTLVTEVSRSVRVLALIHGSATARRQAWALGYAAGLQISCRRGR